MTGGKYACMDRPALDACCSNVIRDCSGPAFSIDRRHIVPGVTTYLAPSFDRDALLFSFPVLFSRSTAEEIGPDRNGSDGAVQVLIEQIKQRARQTPSLAPLYGAGTRFPSRYDATVEPYTVIHSDDAIGAHLWHADARNFIDGEGIHLLVRGALPCPPDGQGSGERKILDALHALFAAAAMVIEKVPDRLLAEGWERSLDQKLLRQSLPALGLVAFVADGSRPARGYTRNRSFFRIAGSKDGTNVPFSCPAGLSPIELELPASNETVTGLGIRKGEVFAVTGSNAQGKTTFLTGIVAGMDDHAGGDGREGIVTVRGIEIAEAMNCQLTGADVSMFFAALPPGMSGTVKAAYGMGSGSMTMASQVQRAFSRRAPILIIDEDRSAPNLLMKSCLQSEDVTPLAELLARGRLRNGSTTLLFAACSADTLIARADRIMVLDRHVAGAIDREQFISLLKASLRMTLEKL